jgi:hypothetical protein
VSPVNASVEILDATPKALPLEGGGLGGGVRAALTGASTRGDIDDASRALLFNAQLSPPSPALPPSRGKGEVVLGGLQ